MKKIVALVLSVAMVLALAACGEEPAQTTAAGTTAAGTTAAGTTAAPSGDYTYSGPHLTIGGADSTGTMYAAAASIASFFTNCVNGLQVDVSTSTGSNENALKVSQGEIELGMCAGDAAYAATHGTGKFEGNKLDNLRGIGCVYSSVVSLIALKSSGMVYCHDLIGKKGVVGIGPAASSSEVSTLAGLKAAGVEEGDIKFENMTLGDGADNTKDGTALAGTAFAGVPVGTQLSAAAEKECVWLAFTDEEIEAVIKENPAYQKLAIPAGTYTTGATTQAEPVQTFGVKCMVICNDEMDKELAYHLAKTLHEQAEEMIKGNAFFAEMDDAAYICNDCPVELHEGALQYYKEAGLIK